MAAMSSAPEQRLDEFSHLPMSSDPKFGVGFYTDNTIGCFDVVAEATPTMLDNTMTALETIKPSSIVIADYGTADGGTSMILMMKLCETLRSKYGDDMPISVWYEDQACNEWTSLFLRLDGDESAGIAEKPPSFIKSFPNTYAYATGVSFYDNCYPAASVHAAVSFTAMHWLTQRPGQMKGAIHHTQAEISEAELSPFEAQAAADWNLILEQRGKELAPGGRMVMVNFTNSPKGEHLGWVTRENGASESMYTTKQRLWKGMADDGVITQAEFENTVINNYYRTEEEFAAPFGPEGTATKHGLKLVSLETKVVKCPYHTEWVEGKSTRTAEEHAKWFVPTTRTWSNASYTGGLSNSRTPDERNAIVDELFDRYAAEVAKDPSKHAMDYVHCYLVIEKL